jgi:hypothetical protein
LQDNLAEVFTKPRLNLIVTDTDESFCKTVDDKIWAIIAYIGYENSELVLPLFMQLFYRTEASKVSFERRLKSLKKEQLLYGLKSFLLSPLTVIGIIVGVIIVIGFVSEQFDHSNADSGYAAPYSSTAQSSPEQLSPTTQATSSNEQDDYVIVGQYRCTKYHSAELDKIRPNAILNSQIESESILLKSESSRLESEQVSVESISAEVDLLSANLKSIYVDQSDQTSIDGYNDKVEEYNTKLQEYRAAVASYNLNVSEHRTRVAQHTDKLERYNSQVDVYNNYLESNCTKCR